MKKVKDTTEPIENKKPETITLTHEDANKVLEYLANQPYREVFQLINLITAR